MASLFSSPLPSTLLPTKPRLSLKHPATFVLSPLVRRQYSLFLTRSSDANGAGVVSAVEEKVETKEAEKKVEKESGEGLGSNGASAAAAVVIEEPPKFKDPRWVGGTWDLKPFEKDGKTDWDAVIDAEARRRKWLEDNPEASSENEPVIFDTSIIPWWAWMKRYHLPEAELLNGRAAMIGFFMAYFVDSLTGAGLVDQMGNFFCKILLFIAVVGVLVIRKNEDIESVKKLIEETTFYDKQWQATWNDDAPNDRCGGGARARRHRRLLRRKTSPLASSPSSWRAQKRAGLLYRFLSDAEISRLRSDILASHIILSLVSSDEQYLLSLTLAEKLNSLNRIAAVAARLNRASPSSPVLTSSTI